MNDTQQPPGATTPPPSPGPAPQGPRVTGQEVRDMGRLRRTHDRKVAGVASGLARHLDVDPLVLRIAFVVLAFFGGSGLVLYGALWLLLPEDGAEHAPLHLDERSRGLAVVGAGILAALLLLGDTWDLYWFPWPLALVGLGVWFLFFREDRPRPDAHAGPAPAQAVPTETQVDASTTYAETYGQPPLPVRPPVTRPRDPRKRGPLLFWFTCALVALGVGVLGIVDLAGAPVVDSAYPALALGLIALMLVVGAFYGRAGGLIALGLVAASVMAGSMATEEFQGEHLHVVPDRSAEVLDTYEMSTGELTLDLRRVDDLEELDGRSLNLSGGVGRIEVLLPPGLDAEVGAEVGGPGRVTLFDAVDRGGISTIASASVDDGPDQPEITLDVELGVGEIVVTTREGESR